MDKAAKRRWRLIASNTKLNFRFHNTNTPEATADYILKIFIEAGKRKLDKAIQEAVSESKENNIRKDK
ncbi:hypothetical protein SDC9_157984 [bioreactor metagenome]|uniref:Uncharacterized protein n=1 Tax=bioreactor metagenome TaxID=1076179 RepID=A0A645F8Y6_9ZZZZ